MFVDTVKKAMHGPNVSRSLIAFFAFCSTNAFAANPPVLVTIEQVIPGGLVLRSGQDAIQVTDNKKTRYWIHRAPVDRDQVKPNTIGWARINSESELHEFADKESWAWLEQIRKSIRQATAVEVSEKYLTVKFEDGTTFNYRATAKSKVNIGGASVPFSEIKAGQKLWLKGRTLANLDTWLVEASDHTITKVVTKSAGAKSGSGKSKGTSSASTLVLDGKKPLEGEVAGNMPRWNMMDIRAFGTILHITYNSETSFVRAGKKVTSQAIEPTLSTRIRYYRDRFGRIIANKIELF